MKKALVSVLTLALCLAALGKDKEPLNLPYTDDGHIQYREVVEVPGVPAAELMKRARVWIASAYRSAPDVMKGNEEDQIIVKGLFDVPQGGLAGGSWKVWHVLTIEAKDGKCRVTISQFEVEWGGHQRTALDSNGYQKAKNEPHFGFRALFAGVDKEALATLASFKAAMFKAPENW